MPLWSNCFRLHLNAKDGSSSIDYFNSTTVLLSATFNRSIEAHIVIIPARRMSLCDVMNVSVHVMGVSGCEMGVSGCVCACDGCVCACDGCV